MHDLGHIFRKAFLLFLSFVLASGTSGMAFAGEALAQSNAQAGSTASLQEASAASYTVTMLVQDAEGEGYTSNSVARQGEVGTVVPTAADLEVDEGFVVVEHESATLESDGSTEVIVRVDRKNYHMTFNANGGIDGPDALYARYGSPIPEIAAPTRVGCVFTGWYEDEACTIAATVPATMPAQDKTYYAGWAAESEYASVDVVYWGENADDAGYSYLSSKTVQAKIGTTYQPKDEGQLDKNLYAFAKSDSIVVASTGNVANIYYDRTTFTWRFGNSYWRANTRWGSITAKWGADVSSQFQSVCEKAYGAGKTSGMWSVVWGDPNEYTAILTHMGTANVDYFDNGSVGNYQVRYLTQNIGADDTPGATEGSSIPDNYTQAYVAFWRSTSLCTSSVDYIDITGFTYLAGPELGTHVTSGGLNFYYKRNWYAVSLNNGEGVTAAISVQYGQNLGSTDVATYVPQRPASVDGHYHFAGWCLNPEASGPVVDLSAMSMPASNLILYAKWVPDTYTVTFSADGESLCPAQQVEFAAKVAQVPDAPEKEGCSFVGWFYQDAAGEHAFDPVNMAVTHDMSLYAKYSGSEMRGWWVYYRLEGTDIDVADARCGEALVGRTLDVAAKTGDALYEAYREGFAPTAASATLEISAEGTNTYTFWYRASTCDLTLTKHVKGLVAPGQTFIFHVVSTADARQSFDVVVRGATSVTVREVPAGTYVVTEDTGWSWRYVPDRSVQAVDARVGGGSYTVEFTNTYGNAHWASSLAGATNVRAA